MADIIQFPRRVRKPQLGICRAPSDSMAPTIAAGDVIEIDEGCKRLQTDGVFVIEVAGEPSIRRVACLPGAQARVSTDAAPHVAEIVDRAALRVLGRVTRHWSERRA